MFVPLAGEIWTKSDDLNCTKFEAFWQKVVHYVYHLWHIVGAILEEVSLSET